MTTIVYDHKNRQIACDGLVVRDGVILSTKFEKYFVRDGMVFLMAGSTCEFDEIIDMVCKGVKKTEVRTSSLCMYVQESIVAMVFIDSDGNVCTDVITHDDAIGSGENWALAALDMGKSAHDAVEYASTRDIYTGGSVLVFDVENMRFVNA